MKGPALRSWLYADGTPRPYDDVDLLVEPSSRDRAEAQLVADGFDMTYGQDDGQDIRAAHAGTWQRARDGAVVDLHTTLPGATAPPAHVWDLLRSHLVRTSVAGVEVTTLDGTATATLVGLHAGAHGPRYPRPIEDLRRGTEVWSSAIWQEANDLAQALGAADTFAAGLSLIPEGRTLLSAIGAPPRPSVKRRLEWTEAPWAAHVLQHAREAPSVRSAAGVVAKAAFPPPRSMRMGTPLARRGRGGLWLAYLVRPLRLARRLPEALAALYRARRSER